MTPPTSYFDKAEITGSASDPAADLESTFEDGDTTIDSSGWSGWAVYSALDSFGTTTTDVITGSYSARLVDTTGGGIEAVRSAGLTGSALSASCKVRITGRGNTGADSMIYYLSDTGGDLITRILFMDNGDIRVEGSSNTTYTVGWQAGEVYTLEVTNIDTSAQTFDASVTGTGVSISDTGISFRSASATNVAQVRWSVDNGNNSVDPDLIIDDVTVDG